MCDIFQTGNNTLIGSLVRLPDNHLHLAESERILRNEEKFRELVELFSTKRQHRKGIIIIKHTINTIHTIIDTLLI